MRASSDDGPASVTGWAWWRDAVIYQIYPRSFQDSDGDGTGDLAGITARLDYLAWLGIDAVWLSPIYPSPMADGGYDVADYRGVDPLFGSMADLDRLLASLHARGIRLILDLVPNHSSDRHPWFVEARASRTSARRDWYIWRDPAPDGGPPNNWQSQAGGGSAWTLDPATGQYYYHAFLPAQPDLNWRNPEVRRAMADVLRFWLDKGVDGFRVDVIYHLMKDPRFTDDPPNPDFRPGDPPFRRVLPRHSMDHPDIHGVVAELRAVLDEYPGERVLIGEIHLPVERLVTYYGDGLKGAQLPFNFQLIHADWRADRLAALIARYEALLPDGAWPNWVLGNHDVSRVASRLGPARARAAALLLLTLRGTPTLYYGDELGMTDVPIPPDRIRDTFEQRMPGMGQGRDPERTPMPWTEAPDAGFTTGRPWLPLGDTARTASVARQEADPGSMLALVHQILTLRRTHPVLRRGDWAALATGPDILAYERTDATEVATVLINLSDAPRSIDRAILAGRGSLLLSTVPDRPPDGADAPALLRPYEGVLLATTPESPAG